MFYLRIIFESEGISVGNQDNVCLGNRYRRVDNPDFECKEEWVNKFRSDHPTCGMLIYPENGDPIPLFSENKNYIVTENGNTYERLKPKDLNELGIRYSSESRSYISKNK